jgi:hypothetical protein
MPTDVSEVRVASIIGAAVRQYIPEDSQLHTRRRENLKSHKFTFFVVCRNHIVRPVNAQLFVYSQLENENEISVSYSVVLSLPTPLVRWPISMYTCIKHINIYTKMTTNAREIALLG